MPSDVMIGPGLICSHDGNKAVSFSVKCLSCEVWKVGKILGEFGKSNVYAENSGMLLIILYGPSNQGMNLVMHDGSPAINSRRWCNVDHRVPSTESYTEFYDNPLLQWNFSCDHSHDQITHDLLPDHILEPYFESWTLLSFKVWLQCWPCLVILYS